MTPQPVSQVDDLVDKVNELTVQDTPPTEDQEWLRKKSRKEKDQEEEEDEDDDESQSKSRRSVGACIDRTNNVYDADTKDAGEPIGIWNEEDDCVDEL